MLSILTLLFSYLFFTAGTEKFRHLAHSIDAIRAYKLTPENWGANLAKTLASLEIFLAAAFLVPAVRSLAIPLAALLLLVYALSMTINLLRGRKHLDCGCNGPEVKQRISWWLIVRNIILIILLAVSYQLPPVVDAGTCLLAILCSATLVLFQQCGRQLYQNQMLISRKH